MGLVGSVVGLRRAAGGAWPPWAGAEPGVADASVGVAVGATGGVAPRGGGGGGGIRVVRVWGVRVHRRRWRPL